MQPSEVAITYADVDPLIAEYGLQPSRIIEDGVQQVGEWFIKHNSLGNIEWFLFCNLSLRQWL